MWFFWQSYIRIHNKTIKTLWWESSVWNFELDSIGMYHWNANSDKPQMANLNYRYRLKHKTRSSEMRKLLSRATEWVKIFSISNQSCIAAHCWAFFAGQLRYLGELEEKLFQFSGISELSSKLTMTWRELKLRDSSQREVRLWEERM